MSGNEAELRTVSQLIGKRMKAGEFGGSLIVKSSTVDSTIVRTNVAFVSRVSAFLLFRSILSAFIVIFIDFC